MLLKIENIDFSYQSSKILDNVTFEVKAGEFLGVMGANGSGKTTLLKCIADVVSPQMGTVFIDGRDVRKLDKKMIAKMIGVVPQISNIDFSFTVSELVLMGRTPHIRRFQTENAHDFQIAEEAMRVTNILHLAERTFDELSGGEKQRVIIARALAQESRILLLDEFTVYLDISSKFEIINIVKNLCKQKNIAVIAVFHDLNMAAQYSDRILLLDNGEIISLGLPDEVLTPENIQKSYHIDVIIKRHPIANTPYITPCLFTQSDEINKGKIVHVICGGGSGGDIMKLLLNNGFKVTTGVLTILDADFDTANSLKIPVIGEIPFSRITNYSHNENIKLVKQADFVIVSDFQIGPGNLKNLDAADIASEFNVPVIVIDSTPLVKKDFIRGELKERFKHLRANGAVFVKSNEDAFKTIVREDTK